MLTNNDSWGDLHVRVIATQLQSAIEGLMDILPMRSENVPNKDQMFCWNVYITYQKKSEESNDHDEPTLQEKFPLFLYRRERGLAWKADLPELEALIGIWACSRSIRRAAKSNAQSTMRNARLVALDSGSSYKLSKIWSDIWIQRRSASNELTLPPGWIKSNIEEDSDSGSDPRFFGWQAVKEADDSNTSKALYYFTQNQIATMCAQDIFISFLAAALGGVQNLSGETEIRTTSSPLNTFQLKNSFIEEMTDCFEKSGLGTIEDAYMCIIPVLTRNSKMPGMEAGLLLAVEEGKEGVVKVFLEMGLNANAKNRQGLSALHLAVIQKHKDVVRVLIKKGAQVNVRNSSHWTALHLAADRGYDEVGKLLIDLGARIDAKDGEGWTALHLAVERGSEGMVRVLIEKGADMNTRTRTGLCALYLAVERGREKVVKVLAEQGADVDEEIHEGWMALHLAADHGYQAIAIALIHGGADINIKNKDGWTALHLTVDRGHEVLAMKLVEQRADINAKTLEGWTALHLASDRGQDGLVMQLVNQGAEINTKTEVGWTALHLAVEQGHEMLAMQLMGLRGIDINIKTDKGWAALNLAGYRRQDRLVLKLVEEGADLTY